MAIRLLFILLLLRLAQAQFIQHYSVINGVPHWRRQPGNLFISRPVLVPQKPVYLEYNCWKMPAICKNARNWLDNPKLRDWPTRPGRNIFTYDMHAGELAAYSQGTNAQPSTVKANSDHRRSMMCPPSWKDNGRRCPESDQPHAMPGPWPYTALETTNPGATLEIQAMRSSSGALIQRSGRMYSCDEFPPASWVEGGVGMQNSRYPIDEGAGQPGLTYCAPIALKCDGMSTPSEQNWQGASHNALRTRLQTQIRAEKQGNGPKGQALPPQAVIQFGLILSYKPGGYAAAIRFYNYARRNGNAIGDDRKTVAARSIEDDFPANLTAVQRAAFASTLTERDLDDYGYDHDIVLDVNKTDIVVRFANGTEVLDSDLEQLTDNDLDHDLPQNATHLYPTPGSPRPSSITTNFTAAQFAPTNGSNVHPWNISAIDVDASLTTYNFETQQVPDGDAIDIIALSEMYIRGQIAISNTTNNGTNWNATVSQAHRRELQYHHGSHLGHSHTIQSNRRAVEGPVQCGPGQPCKDGACCSKDGKCGFKEQHCSPETCLSNCDAKAMCGVDSLNGATKCGLKLCCSFYGWCGTEDVHCKDPEPQFGKTPCQQGYGSCSITKPPSCGKESGSSTGRRVAYYQGWNTRERQCDKVRPKQINTSGLTHLFYAFVFFHPKTFEIMPMTEADVPLYKEFTDLKTNNLQTWVAVGGWSFTNPNTSTSTAFSDMVSTKANRGAFIKSLMTFMDTYGFQGADIDWEYPAEINRGGRPQDTDNLVLLMKEMRAAFGTRYGLSIVLAPDYWYLRGFKPAEMQDYVDFMGFMSYDLHGPWDTDVLTLGSVVRPQTDITEIDKGLTPLWFDGVDPSKINMGIAYYGRSYKLADPSCGYPGCSFIPGKGGVPGACTNSAGVMSNREIRQLIEDKNISPILNETAMVKYFTYDGDSWIGYDDEETYAMKKAFANDRCLGGIMIWSIDFDATVGGGGDANSTINDNLVWIDPKIWETPTPTVQCFFPCTLVLPPLPAETLTTIDYPRIPITVADSTQTTLTFPPITVSEYALSTMIIPTSQAQANSKRAVTDAQVTTKPKLSTTTAWPQSTWTDGLGQTYSTQPAGATLNFPPRNYQLAYIPTLHVRNGVPSPTVSKCAFPALSCPTSESRSLGNAVGGVFAERAMRKGPSPDNIQLHVWEGPIEIPEEDFDEPQQCNLKEEEHEDDNQDDSGEPDVPEPGAEPPVVPPPTQPIPIFPAVLFPIPWIINSVLPLLPHSTRTLIAPTERPHPTATVPFETPVPAMETAVFPKDAKPNCYNKGNQGARASLVQVIDRICNKLDNGLSARKQTDLEPGISKDTLRVNSTNPYLKDAVYVDYIVWVELKEGCIWKNFDFYECARQFKYIVDRCDTKGENGKHGGVLEGNCVKWRIDIGWGSNY